MATDLATLGIRIQNGEIVATTGALDKLTGAGAKAESTFDRLKGAAAGLGIALGAGAIFAKFVKETIDSQNAMAQLEARVKSTGMAAGFTAPQLAAMATEMQGLTTYSDEAVMGAQSLLLTFTKIKGDTLPGATQAVADLATAMGGDLKGAALQVGKALQDPEQGLLALRRSGVSFSEVQQTVIKGLFEAGREAEAQAMILRELKVEFGGAAEAAKNTFGGALKGLANQFGELFEVSKKGTGGIIKFVDSLTLGLKALKDYETAIVAVTVALGAAGLTRALTAATGGLSLLNAQAALSMWFFKTGIPGSFAAAAAAGTGLTGVMVGLNAALAPLLAATGIGLIAGAAYLLIRALKGVEEAEAAVGESEKIGVQLALQRRDAEKTVGEQKRLTALAAELAAKKQADADAKAFSEKLSAATRQLAFDKTHIDQIVKLNVLQAESNRLNEWAADVAKRQIALQDALDSKRRIALQQGGLTMPKEGSELSARLGGAGRGPGWSNAGGINSTDLRTTAEIQRAQAIAAMQKTLDEKLNVEREKIRDNFLRGTQEAFATTFQNLFTKGIKSFGDLFAGMKDLFLNAISQMLAAEAMRKVAGVMGAIGMVAKPVAASETANAAVTGGGVFTWTGLATTAFIGGMVAIGASILKTSQQNAEAARVFEDANIKWRASFQNLMESFTDTGFDKQRKELAAKFQALADAAIAASADAIKNSPAAKFGHTGVGLFGQTIGPVPGALASLDEIDAYIAKLREIQGKGKNMAQDTALADLLKKLTDVSTAYHVQADALAVVLAAQQAAFTQDLAVRNLRAAGDAAAADVLAASIAAERELADARKAGYDATTLAALAETQAAEAKRRAEDLAKEAAKEAAAKAQADARTQEDAQLRILRATDPARYEAAAREAENRRRIEDMVAASASAAAIALEKQAQAAEAMALAAEAAAAAVEKAAQQMSAQQDLEVELLRAKGQSAAADQMEFDLAQQRRMEDAQKNQTEDYVKKLLELQALERANRAAAGAGGAGMGAGAQSTASNVFAGADTVTSSFGARVSAEVGDRMLDNLVSIRVILRAIEGNTRNLGGKLNTSLGLSLADSYALNGSSVIS